MQARIKIFFSGKIFLIFAKNVLMNEKCMKKMQTNSPPHGLGRVKFAMPYFCGCDFLAASRFNLSKSLAGMTEMGRTTHLCLL